MRRRVMYVEHKPAAHNEDGAAWIGWVTFSKTGRTVYTRGLRLQRWPGLFCGNHLDRDTGEKYWVSGVKRRGSNRLYGNAPVEVEPDARAEYERITARR
jgi:hypothetical protein